MNSTSKITKLGLFKKDFNSYFSRDTVIRNHMKKKTRDIEVINI